MSNFPDPTRQQPIEDVKYTVRKKSSPPPTLVRLALQAIPFFIAMSAMLVVVRGIEWYQESNPSVQCQEIVGLIRSVKAYQHGNNAVSGLSTHFYPYRQRSLAEEAMDEDVQWRAWKATSKMYAQSSMNLGQAQVSVGTAMKAARPDDVSCAIDTEYPDAVENHRTWLLDGDQWIGRGQKMVQESHAIQNEIKRLP